MNYDNYNLINPYNQLCPLCKSTLYSLDPTVPAFRCSVCKFDFRLNFETLWFYADSSGKLVPPLDAHFKLILCLNTNNFYILKMTQFQLTTTLISDHLDKPSLTSMLTILNRLINLTPFI